MGHPMWMSGLQELLSHFDLRKEVSGGIIAVLIALQVCDVVRIYGMDTESAFRERDRRQRLALPGVPFHYYNDKRQCTTHGFHNESHLRCTVLPALVRAAGRE